MWAQRLEQMELGVMEDKLDELLWVYSRTVSAWLSLWGGGAHNGRHFSGRAPLQVLQSRAEDAVGGES